MIKRLLVCKARGTDPYENLALEEALLNRVGPGELILYLWQNERTVVIGRNQNPWKECRTALLSEEGGRLARRLSGGGAVFHDLGNLNFTFLMSAGDYDLARQLTVLERACQSLGIPAQRSGRNDLLADGRKFSGNAFYKHNGKAYHHGTLMVDVNMEMVQRYLSPSKAKLAAKGVNSVRARVVNLREFIPDLTIDRLSDAMIAALTQVYPPTPVGAAKTSPACRGGGPASRPVEGCRPPEEETSHFCHSERSEESVFPAPVLPLDVDELDLRDLTAKYASDEWLYGQKLPFTLAVENRFPWGGVELQLDVNEGVIRAAKVYTDSMDETLAPRLEAALTGVPLRPEALSAVLPPAERDELLTLLRSVL